MKITLSTPIHFSDEVCLGEKLLNYSADFILLGPLDLALIFAAGVGDFEGGAVVAGGVEEGDGVEVVVVVAAELHVQSQRAARLDRVVLLRGRRENVHVAVLEQTHRFGALAHVLLQLLAEVHVVLVLVHSQQWIVAVLPDSGAICRPRSKRSRRSRPVWLLRLLLLRRCLFYSRGLPLERFSILSFLKLRSLNLLFLQRSVRISRLNLFNFGRLFCRRLCQNGWWQRHNNGILFHLFNLLASASSRLLQYISDLIGRDHFSSQRRILYFLFYIIFFYFLFSFQRYDLFLIVQIISSLNFLNLDLLIRLAVHFLGAFHFGIPFLIKFLLFQIVPQALFNIHDHPIVFFIFF